MNEPMERNPFGRVCSGCGTRVSMTADGEGVSDQTPCPVCGDDPPTIRGAPPGDSDEVRRRIRAACDCDPGEELAALERLIDYYDGMQAWIEHHFGKIVDEIVLEEPHTEPAPSGEGERDG